MNSSISIQLLIFIAVWLPLFCRDIYKTDSSSKHLQDLTNQDLEEAIQYSINYFKLYAQSDAYLSYGHVEIGSSVHGQLIDSLPSVFNNVSWASEVSYKASKYLLDKYCWGMTSVQVQKCIKPLTTLKLDKTFIGNMCLSIYSNPNACVGKNLNYRTAEGSCNNLKHSFLGMSNTAYTRLLHPAYSDGISKMNTNLPNPRDLSSSLVNENSLEYDDNSTDRVKTIAMAYWMIFISQDLSHTVFSNQLPAKKLVSCCNEKEGMMLAPRDKYWSCAPVNIPKGDRFYSRLRRKCLSYMRSAPAMRTDCTFGPREQVTVICSYSLT